MRDAELVDALFRQAIVAIDADDLPTLERLLAEHPRLATDRLKAPGSWLRDQIGPALKAFFKHPYLLWFLTEDAVRTRRLPANVAAMARAIIRTARQRGAPNLPEQLESTLHFTVCSPVGREDGRQLELLDVLIDAGASIEGAPSQALVCSNDPAAEHLLQRGATLTLDVAVCLGRWDDVARLGPLATAREKQVALNLAALNGKAEGLVRLLPFGVDLQAFSLGFYTHATPVHHAVWSGSLEAVKALVDAGANLATRDKAYGGTPLGWAEHALSEGDPAPPRKQYAEIAAYLRQRGAT